MLLTLLLGCEALVPHLTSPVDTAAWELPTNDWESCDPGEVPEGPYGFDVGDTLPELRGTDQYGNEVSSWQFAGCGKAVLIDMSALWCGPCQDEAPHLPELQEAHADCVQVMTALIQNTANQNPSLEETLYWSDSFGLEGVPVVNDPEEWYRLLFPPGSPVEIPRFILMDETMTVAESQLLPATAESADAYLETWCASR